MPDSGQWVHASSTMPLGQRAEVCPGALTSLEQGHLHGVTGR